MEQDARLGRVWCKRYENVRGQCVFSGNSGDCWLKEMQSVIMSEVNVYAKGVLKNMHKILTKIKSREILK